jgi:hypothetical protein
MIERLDVGGELRGANGGFERHDFGVIGSDKDGTKCDERVGHALNLVRGEVAAHFGRACCSCWAR